MIWLMLALAALSLFQVCRHPSPMGACSFAIFAFMVLLLVLYHLQSYVMCRPQVNLIQIVRGVVMDAARRVLCRFVWSNNVYRWKR